MEKSPTRELWCPATALPLTHPVAWARFCLREARRPVPRCRLGPRHLSTHRGSRPASPGLAFPLPRCGAAATAAQVSGKRLWWTGSASSDRPASPISIISKGQLLNSRRPLSQPPAGVKWRTDIEDTPTPPREVPLGGSHAVAWLVAPPLAGWHTLIFVHRNKMPQCTEHESEWTALWGLMTVAGEFKCKEKKKKPVGRG